MLNKENIDISFYAANMREKSRNLHDDIMN